MSLRALLFWGILLAALAVALAALGGAIKGPANPECAGLSAFSSGCRDAATAWGTAVQLLALPVGIAAGTLVAIWLGRRAQASEAGEP
jgi:hypothetical protein